MYTYCVLCDELVCRVPAGIVLTVVRGFIIIKPKPISAVIFKHFHLAISATSRY